MAQAAVVVKSFMGLELAQAGWPAQCREASLEVGMTSSTVGLTRRAFAILRAVAAGRAEITCSCEPDLFIDGMVCCDQYTAHVLAHRNLIVQAEPGLIGQRVPARLSAAGVAALATVSAAA